MDVFVKVFLCWLSAGFSQRQMWSLLLFVKNTEDYFKLPRFYASMHGRGVDEYPSRWLSGRSPVLPSRQKGSGICTVLIPEWQWYFGLYNGVILFILGSWIYVKCVYLGPNLVTCFSTAFLEVPNRIVQKIHRPSLYCIAVSRFQQFIY